MNTTEMYKEKNKILELQKLAEKDFRTLKYILPRENYNQITREFNIKWLDNPFCYKYIKKKEILAIDLSNLLESINKNVPHTIIVGYEENSNKEKILVYYLDDIDMGMWGYNGGINHKSYFPNMVIII